MRTVFFGTPTSAARSLQALLDDGHDVAMVVTQPDRPKGRGQRVTESPVKQLAVHAGLPAMQPESVNAEACRSALSFVGADLFVVVAFGQIFRQSLLDMPPKGCVNVHFSLLPRYRGAAPVQHALLSGDAETGVTTMYMDVGLDTGDMIFREACAIHPDDTTETLMDRLAAQSARLLLRTVNAIEDGTAPRTPQPETGVVPAPSIRREQGHVDWSSPARTLCCLTRALSASPGCVCWFRGTRIRVFGVRPLEDTIAADAPPGQIVAVAREGFRVACGQGEVLVTELQPEGKARMDAWAFANGYRVRPGDRFDPGDAGPEG